MKLKQIISIFIMLSCVFLVGGDYQFLRTTLD